jgi:predicted component of type VI protein secretion system
VTHEEELQEMHRRADRHIQTLRDQVREDHEANIARAERWAEQATNERDRARHREEAARLRAMPLPWETRTAAG